MTTCSQPWISQFAICWVYLKNSSFFLVKSFLSLAKEPLAEDGVKFLLSEKFTQDPLEEHFAKQRRRKGCNENLDLYQFGKQEIFLNVMNSSLLTDLRGNNSTRINDAPKKCPVYLLNVNKRNPRIRTTTLGQYLNRYLECLLKIN